MLLYYIIILYEMVYIQYKVFVATINLYLQFGIKKSIYEYVLAAIKSP